MSDENDETRYNYAGNIKTPTKMGASDKGTLGALGNDINAIINYLGLLADGDSEAAKGGKPLGNSFFYNTSGKCMDENGKLQDRHIYINNVPDGRIPFIPSDMGGNIKFKSFRGLIPGMISQLNNINPITLATSLTIGRNPLCKKITMNVRNNENITTEEEHHVAVEDIKAINPCVFPKKGGKKVNPETSEKCIESFCGNHDCPNCAINKCGGINETMEDFFISLYIFFVYSLFIYILYIFLKKRKSII